MAENNATCAICGKKYHICLSCRDSMALNPWKIHTDTMEHFKIYQVIHGVTTGVYTRDEAKSKFKNIDLSDLNEFRPHIKKAIQDIFKEDKPIARVEIKKSVVENNENTIENGEVVEKPIISRKRNYKTEVK